MDLNVSIKSTDAEGDAQFPSADRAVDVALAEFNALRAEIVSRFTAQAALVGLGLTTLGVIIGFTVEKNADKDLLLAVPPLTLLVVLLHTAETYRSTQIGTYIGEELWPYLKGQVGELRSWEARVAKRRRGLGVVPEIFFINSPAMIIFILAGIYALIEVEPGGWLWWVDCGVVATAVVAPLGFAWKIREDSKDLAEQTEAAAES